MSLVNVVFCGEIVLGVRGVIQTVMPLIKSMELPHWVKNHEVIDEIDDSPDGYSSGEGKPQSEVSD